MDNNGLTLLVNSCDGFEDCWIPFFTLLQRYWEGPLPCILLNTEKKDWQFPGVPLKTSRVQLGVSHRLTWSECLAAALEQVETPLVLYMQEDYFIERRVDVARIEALARRMIAEPQIRHIGLTHFGAGSPILPTPESDLCKIGAHASYRLSTQAAIWRTDTLRSYVQPWENGWMFEIFGTWRSWHRDELFLTVARDASPPIAYQHTGIVKGQWSRFVPELFDRENLSVDLSRRGFHDDQRPSWKRRLALLGLIAGSPGLALKSVLAK